MRSASGGRGGRQGAEAGAWGGGERFAPLILPAALSALPALIAGVVDLRRFGASTVVHGDLALISWDVERASRAALLVGPYSRFGWHHPGPLLAYWLAPFWWAAGRHLGGLTVGVAVLSAAACSAGVIAMGRAGGRRAAWLTAALLPLLVWRIGLDLFREPWNPDVALLALVTTGVFGAAVIAGRRWWLPAMALAASLAVQTHLGGLVAAAGMVLAATALAAHQCRHDRRALLGPAVAAIAVGCLCWAVPAYEQASAHGGNLSRIARFVIHDGAPLHGFREVRRTTALMLPLTTSGIGRQLSPEVAIPPHAPRWSNDLIVLALVAVAGCAIGRGIRRSRPLLVGLGSMSAALIVAAVVSVVTTRGALYLYLAFPSVAAGIMGWLTAGALTLDIAVDHAAVRSFFDRPTGRRIAIASVCSVIAFCAFDAARLPTSIRLHADHVAAHFARVAAQNLAPLPNGTRVLVDSSQSRWPIAAAIAQHLQARGLEIAAEPNWDFLYDRSAVPNGREHTRLVVIANQTERGLLHHGDRLLNRYQQTELWIGP